MRQLYYESRQLFLLQNAAKFYYKLRLNFITKRVSFFITKRADFIAQRGSYYKIRRLLQNGAVLQISNARTG